MRGKAELHLLFESKDIDVLVCVTAFKFVPTQSSVTKVDDLLLIICTKTESMHEVAVNPNIAVKLDC